MGLLEKNQTFTQNEQIFKDFIPCNYQKAALPGGFLQQIPSVACTSMMWESIGNAGLLDGHAASLLAMTMRVFRLININWKLSVVMKNILLKGECLGRHFPAIGLAGLQKVLQ